MEVGVQNPLQRALEARTVSRLTAGVVRLSVALAAARGRSTPSHNPDAIQLKAITRTTTWRLAQPLHHIAERLPWLRHLVRRIAHIVLGTPPADAHAARAHETEVRVVLESGLFDAQWYVARHTDAPADPVGAAGHYLERRGPCDPGPKFDARWYLANNRDAEGTNVLLHYLKSGRAELRSISPAAERETRQARRHALGADLAMPQPRLVIGLASDGREPGSERAQHSARLAAEQAKLQNFEIMASAAPSGSVAAAHNRLLKRAAASGADLYVAADPEGIFDPGCVAALLRMSAAAGHAALIAASDFPQENSIVYDPETFDVGWAGGGCLLIPLAIHQRIGDIEPSLTRFWDVDFSWRARQAGFAVKTCPAALFHVRRDALSNDWVDEDGLQGGYRLAQLWGHMDASTAIGAELRRYGVKLPIDEPALDGRDPGIADFAHGFGFAPMRW